MDSFKAELQLKKKTLFEEKKVRATYDHLDQEFERLSMTSGRKTASARRKRR